MEKSATGNYYKYCIVPMCRNTSINAPDKVFIRVPNDRRRKVWLKACRRNMGDISELTGALQVCEDHFNLEEDMENYIKFKLMGGQKKMKPHVVPHIFDCQIDRKRAFSQKPRPAYVKRVKRRLVEEAIASTSTTDDLCKPVQTQLLTTSDMDFTENVTDLPLQITRKDVSVTARSTVRSKGIQCQIRCGITVAVSPIKLLTTDAATTPTKPQPLSNNFESSVSNDRDSTDSTSEGEETTSDYSPSYESSTTTSFYEDDEIEIAASLKKLSLNCTIQVIKSKPRMYIGLPDDTYYMVNLLEKYCKLDIVNVLLTLKKIRTGHSFAELADDFGMSSSNASRMFAKSLPVISKYLRKCIVFPAKSTIRSNLPFAFRARYSHVNCIIDCLEIEIEKPSDALKQSLTWSDYKKCNTLKYLISATPDGIINFISTGFGGRTSDAVIVELSGFLDILPPNVAVMADRGFKHIEHLLIAKGCTLIRPPSVSSGIKSTKSEVLATKRIASLRIHIERVIRRVREFAHVQPHACIDYKLIRYTDLIMKIICGLVNLQAALIKGK